MTGGLLWLLPLVGGLIGYLTNWVAVQMLLRPRTPVRIFGLVWLGLIPRRRKEIAVAVADIVSSRLLRCEDIARMVTKGNMGEALGRALDEEIDAFIVQVLTGLPEIVRSIVPQVLMDGLRVQVQRQARAKLPEIAGRAAETLNGSDIKRIIEDRINGLDQLEMEQVALKIARRELRTIEILGGVLGVLIGVIQVGIIVLIGRYS